MSSESPGAVDAGAAAAADRAWQQRYADPERMAAETAALTDGPHKQVLVAFNAWREQRLDEAAAATMTLGYDPSVPHVWRSRALVVRAGLLSQLGLIEESFGVREEALEQARLGGDLVAEVACVHGFGVVYEHSDPQRAQAQYLQVLRLVAGARDLSDGERVELAGIKAVSVVNLYALEDFQGVPVPDWVPSLADVRDDALAAWPAMGAVISAMLADEAREAGDLDRAAALLASCPDPRSMRDVALSPSVATAQARLLAAQGDVPGAVALLEEITERLPPRHVIETLEALMDIHDDTGDPAAALRVARQLLRVTRRLNNTTTAAAVRALEVLYRTEHAEAAARRAAREAQIASQAIGTLKEETTRDELTGVRNRRYLARIAPGLLEHRGAALALVDIDLFKEVNDRFGHAAGDAVLQRVALALGNATRPEDVVARFGGDEFVVLRPAGGGASLADDLGAVTTLRSSGETGLDAGLPVTLSIGVVDTRTGWDATFPLADRAMYEAKRAGGAGVHYADARR